MLVFWAPAPAPFRRRRAGLTALLFSLDSHVAAPPENSNGVAPGCFQQSGAVPHCIEEGRAVAGDRARRGVDVPSCALPWGEQRWVSTRGGGWGGEEDLARMEEQALHRSGDGLGA